VFVRMGEKMRTSWEFESENRMEIQKRKIKCAIQIRK